MNFLKPDWPEAYLRAAIANEIELAKTIGYSRVDVPPAPTRTSPLLAQGKSRLETAKHLPRWRRDWAAAGELIEQLNLSVRQDDEDGTVSVGVRGRRRDVTERYADHPDKGAAILAAIVGAAIPLRAEQRDNATDMRRRH